MQNRMKYYAADSVLKASCLLILNLLVIKITDKFNISKQAAFSMLSAT